MLERIVGAGCAFLLTWSMWSGAAHGFSIGDYLAIGFASITLASSTYSARAGTRARKWTSFSFCASVLAIVILGRHGQFTAGVIWLVGAGLLIGITNGSRVGFGVMVVSSVIAAKYSMVQNAIADLNPLVTTQIIDGAGLLGGALFAGMCLVEVQREGTRKQQATAKTHMSAMEVLDNKNQHLLHMNHELRTPLTSIVGAAGLLASEKESWAADDCRKKQIIQNIAITSNHALAVVNDVLDVERLEANVAVSKSAPFSIRNAIRNAIAMSEEQAAASRNRLRMRVGSELPDQWTGPETRVVQVLLNFIANALKYAPGSDVIISAYSAAGKLILEICDRGPGMAPDVQVKMFDAFASSAGAAGSTGLGLRICKLIVEVELGGTINVVAEPGVGTTFTLTLPLLSQEVPVSQNATIAPSVVAEAGSATPAFAPDGYKQQLYGKRILVVEDDATSNQIMGMILEDAGMTVVCATSSQEALAIVANHPPFDIAMIDHNLGPASKMDGIQLTAQLRTAGLSKLIGHSGNYSVETEKAWIAVGLHSVIRKPISLGVVLGRLAEALDA